MLQEIKTYMKNIPDVPFADYYQQYIKDSQDLIISKNVKEASSNFTSIEDASAVIQGINSLTEELKQL